MGGVTGTLYQITAAERIIVMQKVNKIMRKQFQDFLVWLGVPKSQTHEHKVSHVFKTISEFALEFRTSRERAQQTLKFKREAKERNRSRAKLHELVKNSSKSELNMLLSDVDAPRRKKKKHREHRRRRGEHALEARLAETSGRREGELSPDPTDPSEQGAVRPEQRRRRRREEAVVSPEADCVSPPPFEEERERRRSKKTSRNVSEQTVQLMNGQSIPETEVDAGLFKSLMDMGRGKIRRNGERRRSTKVRESSLGTELMRSRTRENTDRLLEE